MKILIDQFPETVEDCLFARPNIKPTGSYINPDYYCKLSTNHAECKLKDGVCPHLVTQFQLNGVTLVSSTATADYSKFNNSTLCYRITNR